MSKILDALSLGEKKMTKEKSTYTLTQEQLADIYFSGRGKEAAKPELPMVIQVVEKPRQAASAIPWIITSVAFLITALSLFSTKRIFVDVKVIDEKHPWFESVAIGPWEDEALPSAPSAGRRTDADQWVPFEAFTFEGAAKLKSTKSESGLMLVNSSVAPFARASIYFDKPVNWEDSKVVFYARGHRGGEDLAVAAKDVRSILAFTRGKIYPLPQKLSTDWQRVEVNLKEVNPEFNRRQVKSLRFDFGSKDTNNKSGDTLFIRDLRVIPDTGSVKNTGGSPA